MKVIIPPLPEQQRIAEILSAHDELITKTSDLTEKTKEVKHGLMQELLTKGIEHTEFKDSELGRIPKDWKVDKIGNVSKFQGGFAFKSDDYVEDGIKLAKITNVQQGCLDWDDTSCLPTEYLNEYKDFRLNIGDIVLAMTRPIISSDIKVARIKERDTPSLLNQRVGRFVAKKDVCTEYLYHVCFSDSFIKKVQVHSTATNQPNISSKQIESILIAVPQVKEQQEIASTLSMIDEKLEALSKRKQQLEEIKQGLMQDLLTGRVRVGGFK